MLSLPLKSPMISYTYTEKAGPVLKPLGTLEISRVFTKPVLG